MGFMVLWVRPTTHRFPTNTRCTPVGKQTLAFYAKFLTPVGQQSPWRMLTKSGTSARFSSQTARAPRRSEAGRILLVPHSLACNPVFGRGVKYRCKGQVVMRSILLYGCETWPVRVADESMLEAFDNDSIRRILRVRRRDCVPSVELHRRPRLTSIAALLVQRRLRWFGHAARRREGELIKNLLLPTPPRTWRRRVGSQLMTWATMSKADLEPLSAPRVFGHARWRKDWVKVSSELAQDCRAWSASVRDVANAIGDAGSTHPGLMPTQVQVVQQGCRA